MEQKALVYFTNPWEFVDEKTGELRVGITIEYLLAENLRPVENDNGSKGIAHCKQSLSTDKLPNIKEVPGYYNLKFALKSGSKGKPSIVLDDIEYLGTVEGGKKSV